jgi:hypothetical protein
VCGALLLLLCACATPAPGVKAQVTAPLVAPKPLTVPVPLGMSPPAPILVVPDEVPDARALASEKEQASAQASERRPECIPRKVPHLGGDPLHDACADRVPLNAFAGFDVLVDGKRFDALQVAAGVLWEVKTDNFDRYTAFLQETVPKKQVLELRRERDLASACGYAFRVGVRSAAHRAALLEQEPSLDIVVMDWC